MVTKICLNMIVKDEEKVITRCFDSVVDSIDAMIISDTGSSDNTVEIMEQYAESHNLPGGIYQDDWKGFHYNRNIVLKHGVEWILRNKTENEIWYLMIIDADDKVNDPQLLKQKIQELKYDRYLIDMISQNTVYGKTFLVKIYNGKVLIPWIWESVIHEYITAKVKITQAKLDGIQVVVSRDGNRSSDPMKYFKDILVLETELRKDYNDRYMFYLAQSYKDYGNKLLAEKNDRAYDFFKMAEKTYIERYNHGGWEEEQYISLLEAAKCRMVRRRNGHKTENLLSLAVNLRPQRFEAVYYLIRYYRMKENYQIGYSLGVGYIDREICKDLLFMDRSIHKWKIWDELAICAFYVNDKKLYKELYQRILNEDVPLLTRNRIQEDLKTY